MHDPVEKCRDAYQAWQAAPHYTEESSKLCDAFVNAQSDLLEHAPTTMAGYLTKWREFVRYERELETDDLDYVPVMSQMLDELAALVGKQ